VKKTFLKSLDIDKEPSIKTAYSNNLIKTTDVNILLNRVREDKRKSFKKKFLTFLVVVLSLSLLAILTTL
tara:strand:+ start:941 stop:1150 length:210 start_codon:yes stop_codon:yes gene_type:complete